MDNQPSSPWLCPYCSRCFSTQEDIRNHLELRLRNALPELLKVLSNVACYPAHDAVKVPRTLERELDETLGDSIEDETETETESETETETETHTGKKNRLRCPHQECKRKKASYSRKHNMMRHYHSHVVCDAKCVCGEGFTRLFLFEKHLKTCQTKKDREKQGLDEKQIQIIGLVHHLRDQASKQVDQELGLGRGHKRKQQLIDKDERVDGGCTERTQEPDTNASTGGEHELERGRDEVDTPWALSDELDMRSEGQTSETNGSTCTHLSRPRKRQRTDADASSASNFEDEIEFSGQQADSSQSIEHDDPQRSTEGVYRRTSIELGLPQVNIQEETGKQEDSETSNMNSSQWIESSAQNLNPSSFFQRDGIPTFPPMQNFNQPFFQTDGVPTFPPIQTFNPSFSLTYDVSMLPPMQNLNPSPLFQAYNPSMHPFTQNVDPSPLFQRYDPTQFPFTQSFDLSSSVQSIDPLTLSTTHIPSIQS